jgi:Stage II sporulation protein E (SpoIIE)
VEEFVTAVLAQVSADGGRAEILNCGHPPPLLVRDGAVIAAEASLPLGLAALLPEAREVSTIPLKPGDRLLFYTDGITEARDRRGTFYSLEWSGALLVLPDLGSALDQLIEDVLRHVGHALQHDAAILLIGLGQPLPGTGRPCSGQMPRGSDLLGPYRGHPAGPGIRRETGAGSRPPLRSARRARRTRIAVALAAPGTRLKQMRTRTQR